MFYLYKKCAHSKYLYKKEYHEMPLRTFSSTPTHLGKATWQIAYNPIPCMFNHDIAFNICFRKSET